MNTAMQQVGAFEFTDRSREIMVLGGFVLGGLLHSIVS
jgi:hypothetical protein